MGSGSVMHLDSSADFSAISVACFLTELPYLLPFPYLFTSLSTSVRIGLFLCQAIGRKRRPNLALVCCVHFVLQYISLWMHACFCCVQFSFSVPSQDIYLGQSSSQ